MPTNTTDREGFEDAMIYLFGLESQDFDMRGDEYSYARVEAYWTVWQRAQAQSAERVRELEEAFAVLISHAEYLERELDMYQGLGGDAGSGCSITICKAKSALGEKV